MRLIEFIDDFFNFDRERTLAILRGIAERYPDLRIALTNGVRGDMLDEEIIEHIKRANCVQIGVAVETVSPRLQKLIRKNLDLEKLKETLRLLRKHRIQGVHTFFITGLPTETAAEAQAIRRFVAEQDLDYPLLFIAMPFNKKSPLYQMIPPDRLAAAKKEEGYCDYRWGNLTFGELPYAELEKMQMEFFLRRMLRRRNLPRFLSLVRGLLFRFFFRGDWMALRWIVEHLALRGSGENVDRARQRKLQKKRRDMQRLAAALGVAPARPTP